MADRNRRESSLDLAAEDLRALLAGVSALAEHELAATRSGPVFERPPSAVEIDRVVGADRALPVDGEGVDELLAACAGVLAAGRRTPDGAGLLRLRPVAAGTGRGGGGPPGVGGRPEPDVVALGSGRRGRGAADRALAR
jgi:hypothetical protein